LAGLLQNRILWKGGLPKYAKYRFVRKLVLRFAIENVVKTGTYLGDFSDSF
jgi:hypothetical protein